MTDNNNSISEGAPSVAADQIFSKSDGKLSMVEKVGYGLGDTASNILYQAWSFLSDDILY